MATINWGQPTQASLYTDVLTLLDARLKDLALQFPTTNTYTNLPTNTISFRNNKWQYWSGASWVDLRNYSAATPEYYDIGILGTASNVRGTVAAANGGTGKSSYAVGDLLIASSTTALTAITAPVYGKVLLSQGSGTAAMPAWGSLNLQDHVTSYLSVANGGTGVTSITGIIKGNGTGAFTAATAGVDYAAASHTHSYLPLSGGTLTGTLTLNNATISSNSSISASSITTTGSITVSTNNTTGGGIILSDDGDIVDVNDGYCAIRFSSGLRVHSGKSITGVKITLGSDGNITATGDVTAYSDIRLKTDIRNISNALSNTCKLNGVQFNKEGKPGIGVIAQEVQTLYPEAVLTDDKGYLSVAYGNLVGLLIEAIKELNAKVERLENAG